MGQSQGKPDTPGHMTGVSGRGAASLKYDVITALGAWGCAGGRHDGRLALRLVTLLTARYNWAEDSLTTGQREIAALWSVDARTVKRDMARLRDRGWLVLKRPAARGRVACYGLGLDAILAETRPIWPQVGPDYAARMDPAPQPLQALPTILPFPVTGQGAWARVAARLQAEDPALFAVWFAPLIDVTGDGDRLCLRAPSRFHGTYIRTHLMARLQAAGRPDGHEIALLD